VLLAEAAALVLSMYNCLTAALRAFIVGHIDTPSMNLFEQNTLLILLSASGITWP
jgi:hypothetical protein